MYNYGIRGWQRVNYEGWMISLYEFYEDEYKRYYQVNNEKFFKKVKRVGVKRALKDLFYFPSKWKMIGFVIYCISEIFALITYLIGFIKDDQSIVFIGIVLMIIPPLILVNTTKYSIYSYEKNIIVLKKILMQKKIDSDKKIERLIKDTEKYMDRSKIFAYIFQLIQISIPGIKLLLGDSQITTQYSVVINNFIDNNSEVISLIIIISIFIIGIYFMIINRPEGKKQKLKELNNLLKITSLYI